MGKKNERQKSTLKLVNRFADDHYHTRLQSTVFFEVKQKCSPIRRIASRTALNLVHFAL